MSVFSCLSKWFVYSVLHKDIWGPYPSNVEDLESRLPKNLADSEVSKYSFSKQLLCTNYLPDIEF